MNIAFVNATRKWGGVKTWMLDVGEALKERGHSIFVYGRQPEFLEQARLRTGHGVHMVFGPDLNPMAVMFFLREFRAERIDAVFINIEKDLATAGVAAHMLDIPVIQRIGMPQDIPHRFKTGMLHKVVRPRFFCPCRYIADGFIKSLPYVREQDVKVMITAKQVTEESLTMHTPRQLVATQQLNADKGHDVLLRALAPVSTPFVLHVVGTGKEEEALKALARELGLTKRVVWHGFCPNVASVLRQADIFLLASLTEGLPNTLLEALAQGLLPVVRDVGGVREVLTPAMDPWVLPPDAGEQAFREVIERALALPDEALLQVREAARDSARQFCDINRMVEQLEFWLEREVIHVA